MTLIKKIIFWLIELIRSLFCKKKQKKKTIKLIAKPDIDKAKNKIDLPLPNYMIVDDSDRDQLIYSISLMKNLLLEESNKIKEKEISELIKTLEETYNIKVNEILDQKYLETVVKDLDNSERKEIITRYNNIVKKNEDFKVHVNKIDRVIDEINKHQISIVVEDEIKQEIDEVVTDKDLGDGIDQKVDYFNKNALNIIDTVDNDFLNDVVKEYNKINYVTVTTMIIDRNYQKFRKLEDNFRNHRHNKNYYEREINRIKHELKQIKSIKNKKEVSEHINRLKKELYTKSKDKYDLLYNNEVFMNFEKKCDNLLAKVNVKVVDIKKEKQMEEKPKKKEDKRKEYLENILLRFKDLELARRLIMLSQVEDNELINNSMVDFIDVMCEKYSNGVGGEFNFLRNKRKTELVILFNELNMAISKEKKEPFISIDHINFRMEDLEEAVEAKKEELKAITKKDIDIGPIRSEEKVNKKVYNSDTRKRNENNRRKA